MAMYVGWKRVAGAIVLSSVCGGSALAQEPSLIQEPPLVQEPGLGVYPSQPQHAVFQPALPIPTRRPLQEVGYEFPTKPVFLKGYAGNLYGRGPREAFIPTGYGVGTIQPVATGDPVLCRPRRWGFWNH
jgi:hypothetical protein